MVECDTFSIGEVAAMIGVSADTLRAWERRYNVVSPARTLKNQRRYSADDVRLLARISDLCLDGVGSIQQAVMAVKGLMPEASLSTAADVPDDQPLWREVLDRSGVPMLILDVQGRIVDANTVLLAVMGKSREAVRGRRVAKIIMDAHKKALPPAVAPAGCLEIRLKTPAGARTVVFDCMHMRFADDWFQIYIGQPLDTSTLDPERWGRQRVAPALDGGLC